MTLSHSTITDGDNQSYTAWLLSYHLNGVQPQCNLKAVRLRHQHAAAVAADAHRSLEAQLRLLTTATKVT